MTTLRATLALAALLAAHAGEAAAQAAEPPASQTTQQRRGRQSWTSDRRDYAPGDLITVLVDEYTLASANRGNFASDQRFRDLGLGVSQTAVNAIPSGSVDVSTVNDAESRQRGEATRQNRFQGELTARVVEVGPNGMLRIEGKKVVHVDNHQEELTLTGWVRPQDINQANLVDSWRVGDAQLVYSSNQSLGTPRGGFIGRMLGRIWP